ncbi:methyltryptophan oxidase [Bacillaceae bacterium JMAK1]|nr:methyltryptophan oxidase [Bacillaceae bacterium JMAK1]
MRTNYDVIIVGAGSMGMAAGYYLSKQGVQVLLIDRDDPPHINGSHHGDTRIIRHAYGEGREYVPLALRSQTLWDELETFFPDPIFINTGVIGFGPATSPFLHESIASANEYNLTYELLTADEANERWPGLSLTEGMQVFFEPHSGVLYSENSIRAYRTLAIEQGATLLTNTPVESVSATSNGALVTAADVTYTADKLIISAGAYNPDLWSQLGLTIPLTPTRQSVAWYHANQERYGVNHFPAFFASFHDREYYGFPDFDGTGLKIGRHDIGKSIHPSYIDRTFGSERDDESATRQFLETYMPDAAGPLNQGKICMYTRTPDLNFILDRHPKYPSIILAGGFSGHGFKFASVIGELLSSLATDQEHGYDLRPFSIQRDALQQSIR